MSRDPLGSSREFITFHAGAHAPTLLVLRATHRAELAGSAAPTEEPVLAVGFQARDVDARRQLQRFEHLAVAWIDAAQLALVTFPGGVPHLAVHPGHAGDEAVRLDGAQDLPGLRI